MTTHMSARKPRIRMIADEADRLTDLALSARARMPGLCDRLLGEIERAQTVSPERIGADVVTMGADITYADEASGQRRTVRLVYPGEADIAAGRVSILTPIGAALIGLSVGQSILWPDRAGHERALTILDVRRSRAAGLLVQAGDDRHARDRGRPRRRPVAHLRRRAAPA